jgi:hypothetical protein
LVGKSWAGQMIVKQNPVAALKVDFSLDFPMVFAIVPWFLRL